MLRTRERFSENPSGLTIERRKFLTKENIKKWFAAAFIRAVKTMAQTAVATIGTSAVVLDDVNWLMVGSASVLAAILSMLTSTAGLPEVEQNN